MKATVALLLLFVTYSIAKAIIPYQYPLFKQCDPRWGNDWMNGTNPQIDTICDQGCAMSSIAMMLNGKGYTLSGQQINPGTLNTWIRANKGYIDIGGDPDNLDLPVINEIDPQHINFISEKEKPAIQLMQHFIEIQNPMMVAHVHNKTHFVLVVGYETNSNTFYVNDPFYSTSTYQYSDMSDLLLYNVAKLN